MTAPGAIEAVIFDWAGTLVDFGCIAPLRALCEAFADFGVALGLGEARGPMGLAKHDHIRALAGRPAIAAAWRAAQGAEFTEADVERVYEVFLARNRAGLAASAEPIPGAVALLSALRARGLKVGSTTGYTRALMAELAPLAAARGIAPDTLVCGDDLAAGRPSPLGMARTLAALRVAPPAAAVKVDDTAPGLGEGIAAGCWVVGVTDTGNGMGLDQADLLALPPGELARRRAAVAADLRRAGAHLVIESVAALLPALARIEAAMAIEARPRPLGASRDEGEVLR